MNFKKSKTLSNNVYVKFHVHCICGGDGPKLSLDFQKGMWPSKLFKTPISKGESLESDREPFNAIAPLS